MGAIRDNNLIKQDVSSTASNIDLVMGQQGDTKHKQFGNKEQIKTMISTTSCNLVAINHQVHRRARCICFTKVIYSGIMNMAF